MQHSKPAEVSQIHISPKISNTSVPTSAPYPQYGNYNSAPTAFQYQRAPTQDLTAGGFSSELSSQAPTTQCEQQWSHEGQTQNSSAGLKNVLTFRPEGFHRDVRIQFPDHSRSLVVCKRCKRNYKTRDHCRNISQHTDLPWTDIYLCFIIDESCVMASDGADEDNDAHLSKKVKRDHDSNKHADKRIKYVNDKSISFDAHIVQWQPFEVKPDALDLKMPVCAACKRKNYTRAYCRVQRKHRHLPWSTEFVVLEAVRRNNFMPPQPKKTPSSPKEHEDEKVKIENSLTRKSSDVKDTPASENTNSESVPRNESINDIDPSRAFLLKISCEASALQWLETSPSALSSSLTCMYNNRVPSNHMGYIDSHSPYIRPYQNNYYAPWENHDRASYNHFAAFNHRSQGQDPQYSVPTQNISNHWGQHPQSYYPPQTYAPYYHGEYYYQPNSQQMYPNYDVQHQQDAQSFHRSSGQTESFPQPENIQNQHSN
eukprot:CAMPEP_0194354084 /NCGR_PEP_ID=MMETSP0174-20130528/2270_1 /TAXON_ID=216777 /ORGANISM="Proboscia alata, Strain PI-D3" /LENGTH=483 /DNA_ID=CAMNT_0039122853 /DNA_START=87 /DNA_END=1538 /DNA_ORIENTATION=+